MLQNTYHTNHTHSELAPAIHSTIGHGDRCIDRQSHSFTHCGDSRTVHTYHRKWSGVQVSLISDSWSAKAQHTQAKQRTAALTHRFDARTHSGLKKSGDEAPVIAVGAPPMHGRTRAHAHTRTHARTTIVSGSKSSVTNWTFVPALFLQNSVAAPKLSYCAAPRRVCAGNP